jgi:hypothetical protein
MRMWLSRLRVTPATAIAMLALLIALGGTAVAARHYLITSTQQIAPKVRVALRGSRGARGPQGSRGPQGAQGPAGNQGSSGPTGLPGATTITQPPAYSLLPGAMFGTCCGSPLPLPDGTGQGFVIFTCCAAAQNLLGSFEIPLLSPSGIAGSGTHLASVQFCIDTGPQTNGPLTPSSAAVTVTDASVYEFSEPPPAVAGTGDSTGPPAYSTPTKLIDTQYTGETTKSDCLTVAATGTAPAIDPNGFLALRVTLSYTAAAPPNGLSNEEPTNSVWFGRVTTNYTP